MKTELKPCPFCGSSKGKLSTRIDDDSKEVFFIECENCHSNASPSYYEENAIPEWNTRVQTDEKCSDAGTAFKHPLQDKMASDMANLKHMNEALNLSWHLKEKEIVRLQSELATLRAENEELKAKIQICKSGHKYLANSHEYPCPWCELGKREEEKEDLRIELTTLEKFHEQMEPVLILKAKEKLEKANARIEELKSEINDLSRQMIAVAVMDLGYNKEPLYGHSPMRHQFLWSKAEKHIAKEDLQNLVCRCQSLVKEYQDALANDLNKEETDKKGEV